MTDSDKKQLKKALHKRLQEKPFGFCARAHLLFLAFLHGRAHETIERRVHASTYYGRTPLAAYVRFTLCSDPPLLPEEDFPLEEFSAWCSGLKGRIKGGPETLPGCEGGPLSWATGGAEQPCPGRDVYPLP